MNISGIAENNGLLSENCSWIQDWAPDLVDLVWIRVMFAIFYSTIWIIAVVGNLLVLYVVTLNQVSLSVRSVFIGCLAASDLLMSITSLPVTSVTLFTRNWIFPSMFCRPLGVFQGGSIFVSSFTLTAIAIDRCLLIIRPNKHVVSFQRAVLTVFGIWVLGYSLALPMGIYTLENAYPGTCGTFCEERWPDATEENQSDSRRLYGLSVMLLQFSMPALISSVCYWMISKVMAEQIRRRRGHNLRVEAEEKLVSRKSRANRMMLFMVFCFICCWIPINILNLYRDFAKFDYLPKWFSIAFAFSHTIAMTSAVANPIIYSFFNPQFRAAVQYIFSRRQMLLKRMSYPTSITLNGRTDTLVRPDSAKKRNELIVPEKVAEDFCQPSEGDDLL